MLWVGLTGGLGSGKSSALKAFKDLGAGCVSADQLVHNLYQSETVLKEIKIKFEYALDLSSEEVILKLRREVFTDIEKLKSLERILHPLVRKKAEQIKQDYKTQGYEIAVYEVPLLFEKNMQELFDFTVCVGLDEEQQLKRIKLRNDWADEEIQRRMSSQLSNLEKKKRADFYIDNSGSLESLKKSVQALYNKMLKL